MIDTMKEQWALFVIAFGVLFGTWTMYARPALESKQGSDAKLAALELERDAFAMRPGLGSNQGDGSDTAGRTRRLLELRFGDESLIGEQDRLYELADEAGVRIERIDPETRGQSFELGIFVFRTGGMKAEVAGTYGELTAFFSLLSEAPACVVDDLSIRETGSGDELSASLRVRTGRVIRRADVIAEGGFE